MSHIFAFLKCKSLCPLFLSKGQSRRTLLTTFLAHGPHLELLRLIIVKCTTYSREENLFQRTA